jgi:NADH-quinone oxidoreductase subunit E
MSELISALSPEEIDAIEAEVVHLPERRSAAIEALRIVQEKRGWISDESLAAIAHQLDMSVDALDAVATFYNLIFRKPVGRHVVFYCDSVSCYVMGCRKVEQALIDRLGIEPGNTTADDRFTLLPTVCLGACDRAPVLMIDDELYGEVAPDSLEEVLSRHE